MSEVQEDWDEERPARHRKIPLKKELAAVPPTIMDKLREELLLNPDWCPLTASETWRSERFGDLDSVALANVRARKLLVKCHRMKWRRQKVSPCYEAIARLTLGEFAIRVLKILDSDSVALTDALETVIIRLESLEFGNLEEASGRGSFEDGLRRYQKYREARGEQLRLEAKSLKWKWQRDETGKLRPAPFEAGLQALIPVDYFRGKRARDERLKRFTSFLDAFIAGEHPDWSDKQRGVEVKARLKAMRKDGIEAWFYRQARIWFHFWFEGHTKDHLLHIGEKGRAKQARLRKNRPDLKK
jgi:hypothetical protein